MVAGSLHIPHGYLTKTLHETPAPLPPPGGVGGYPPVLVSLRGNHGELIEMVPWPAFPALPSLRGGSCLDSGAYPVDISTDSFVRGR